MRFLVDSCVSASVCDFLRQEGHDAIWVPDEFLGDPGEWIFLRGKPQPPLVRLTAMAPNNQVHVMATVLKTHSTDLENGALITATRDRLRVRRKNE